LALALAGQGRLDEAIVECERALAQYSNLPRAERDRLLPEIARCGVNLASVYQEAGDLPQSLRALEESRAVYSLLREGAPTLFVEPLTEVLRLIAEIALSIGQRKRAFRALVQLIDLIAPDELEHPDADALLDAAEPLFCERAHPDRGGILELLELLKKCVDEASAIDPGAKA
jgi:tetratricopeptide (TPR) repeat protein